MKWVGPVIVFCILCVLIGCKSCPKTCDDGQVCTRYSCSAETNYQCINQPVQPCCGNTKCEVGETNASCSIDCVTCFVGVCERGTFDYDAQQCKAEKITPCCGNLRCEVGETNSSCPSDCVTCIAKICERASFDYDLQQCSVEQVVPCCGNSQCETGETHGTCADDCIDCDDNDEKTIDLYDYQAAKCTHTMTLSLTSAYVGYDRGRKVSLEPKTMHSLSSSDAPDPDLYEPIECSANVTKKDFSYCSLYGENVTAKLTPAVEVFYKIPNTIDRDNIKSLDLHIDFVCKSLIFVGLYSPYGDYSPLSKQGTVEYQEKDLYMCNEANLAEEALLLHPEVGQDREVGVVVAMSDWAWARAKVDFVQLDITYYDSKTS